MSNVDMCEHDWPGSGCKECRAEAMARKITAPSGTPAMPVKAIINGPLSEWPPAQVEVVNKLLSSGLITESVYGYSTTADGGLVVEQLKTLLQGILQERGPHAEIARLNALLAKHGVCTRCSELFEHDYEAPFASCGCKQSEWHELTPHMLAVQRAKEVAP